nr:hypothetical protein [Paludibacteraceae bacterium]
MGNSTEFAFPVSEVHGKVDKQSNKYHRKQYGKMRTVTLNNPRTSDKWTEHEWAFKRHFAEVQAEAVRIYNDPVLYAPYKEKFENQTAEENLVLTGKKKIYVKADSFVFACLMKERKVEE